MNSAIFVSAAIDLKLDFGASKAFVKKIYPLYVFFKLIYAIFWCLFTDLTLFALFWINQWAESPGTALADQQGILQMNKLRVHTLKMEKQP